MIECHGMSARKPFRSRLILPMRKLRPRAGTQLMALPVSVEVRPETGWPLVVWCCSYFHSMVSLFGSLWNPEDIVQFPRFWLTLNPQMFSKHHSSTGFCFVYPTLGVTAPNLLKTRDPVCAPERQDPPWLPRSCPPPQSPRPCTSWNALDSPGFRRVKCVI